MSAQGNEGRIKLRQKMINLMYLIFIVLAFLYIPTDFIDTLRDINKSLEPSAKHEDNMRKLGTQLIKMSGKADSIAAEANLKEYNSFLNLTDSVYTLIDSFKTQLLSNSRGYNPYGYIYNASEFQLSDKVFIAGSIASRLRNTLIAYKTSIQTMSTYIGDTTVNSILNTDSIILNSLGKPKQWEYFYFKKIPVTVSVALLSKFKNDVSKIQDLTIHAFIDKVTGKYELALKDKAPTPPAPPEEKKKEEEKKEQPQPPKPKNVQPYPSIDKKELEVLYLGVKNPMRIYHPAYRVADMYAEITNGEIRSVNDTAFYATPSSAGPLEIKIYNKGAGNTKGGVLLMSKQYTARELPIPRAYIADRVSGTISTKILSLQNGIDLKNDDMRPNDAYYVKQYSLVKISPAGAAQTSNNTGASFNSATRQLIDGAQRGDILIFDNIKVAGPNGAINNIPSLVLNIF